MTRLDKAADSAETILRKLMPRLLPAVLIAGFIAISAASVMDPVLLFGTVPILLLLVAVLLIVIRGTKDGLWTSDD